MAKSLEQELKPYIDALVGRDQPLGKIEMRGFVNKLSSITLEYKKNGGLDPTEGQTRLSADDKTYLEKQISLSLEKLAQSADTIMDAVDKISAADGDTRQIRSKCNEIMQSCDFHDLVGQRLMEMKIRLSQLGSVDSVLAREATGPSMGASVDQEMIDQILSE